MRNFFSSLGCLKVFFLGFIMFTGNLAQANPPLCQKSSATESRVVIDGRTFTIMEDVVPVTTHGREFVSFLKQGESRINGWEMLWEAMILKANLGLTTAKYDLEHQDVLLGKQDRDTYLVYVGTILCNSSGDRGVPLLRFSVETHQWILLFRKLDTDYHYGFRLARSK